MSMSSFVRTARFFSHGDIIVANNERCLRRGAITTADGRGIFETEQKFAKHVTLCIVAD